MPLFVKWILVIIYYSVIHWTTLLKPIFNKACFYCNILVHSTFALSTWFYHRFKKINKIYEYESDDGIRVCIYIVPRSFTGWHTRCDSNLWSHKSQYIAKLHHIMSMVSNSFVNTKIIVCKIRKVSARSTDYFT